MKAVTDIDAIAFTPASIHVPATSANLGPGFDCFGLSLGLCNVFSITPAAHNAIRISGFSDSELAHPESNLVFGVYSQLCRKYAWQPQTFALHSDNGVPLFGGMGSSATAIVAGIAIANHIHNAGWDRHAMLHIAYDFEQHLDNIGAAIFGGFVVASHQGGRDQAPLLLQREIDAPLCAWVIVPNVRVSTSASRVVMPTTVPLQDAVYNLAYASQVALAFERQDWNLLRICMRDRLHQPYRIEQSCGLLGLQQKLLDAGAYGVCLSGSGPAVLVLCDKPNDTMQQMVDNHLVRREIAYTSFALAVDNRGMHYQA